jgi:hypothetical protein
MASSTKQALNRAARATARLERGTGMDPITLELRRLQALRQSGDSDVTDVLEALVPAAAAACAAGHLVSFSKARGTGTVLFRIRQGDDWLDWYCAEADFAAQVSDEIVKAFSGS